jgi:NAD(P)-dependent dehydrogenase (short-subunit alcohol dehydrogenase family)
LLIMGDLTGKVVAITGAGSGLGRALAINFAQHGMSVALADVDQHGLLDTASMISSNDRAASTHRIDVSDQAAVEQFATEVEL